MTPLYQAPIPDDGEIKTAFPDLTPTVEVVRWRMPGDPQHEAHSGYVWKDKDGRKVVAGTFRFKDWVIFDLDSVEQINDENRTPSEQAAWEKKQAELAAAAEAAEVDEKEQLKKEAAEAKAANAALTDRMQALEDKLGALLAEKGK